MIEPRLEEPFIFFMVKGEAKVSPFYFPPTLR
jgi:hypothetical protein